MNRSAQFTRPVLSLLAAGFMLSACASPSLAQSATKAQQKCVNGFGKAVSKLIAAQDKDLGACLKNASKSKLTQCTDADACANGDLKGKVAKASAKVSAAENDGCAFGIAAPAWFEGESDLQPVLGANNPGPSGYVLGPSLASAVIAADTDKTGAACQQKTQKAAAKLGAAVFKEWLRCMKSGLSDGTIDSAAALEACYDTLVTDPKGKLGKAAVKLEGTVTKSCGGVDLDAAFPTCAGQSPTSDCLTAVVRCRSCQIINRTSGVARDCDVFDDAAANGSCTIADGRCNGSADLCDRTFDQVAYATAHNAMSASDENWGAPLQTWGIRTQLDRGVRGLMLDTYYYMGDTVLCHAICDFPTSQMWREPFVDGLVRIREFLEARPEEIVSIIFESYISEADTATAFTAAGLDSYLHSQTVGDPWPTLRQMIDAGTRLVVLTDDASATLPWHLYQWDDFVFETPFSYASENDFVCTDNRGAPGNDLFILNHFITNPVGMIGFAEVVNQNPLLTDRALECQTFQGRIPNFVTVDFSDVGGVLDTVDELNTIGSCDE